MLQHLLGHAARLLGLVAHGDQARAVGRGAVGPQRLGKALGGKAHHAVGGIQDRLRGAVIALQQHRARRPREMAREVEDIAHRRRTEGVDGLRIVADHRQAAPVRAQRAQDRCLQPVGVLVFVDEDVVEARTDLGGQAGVGHHRVPVQQQVVVVEDMLGLLGLHVGVEQRAQLRLPHRAPREVLLEHGIQRALGVDGARVDRQAGLLEREAARLGRQVQLMPHDIEQIGRVAAVVDGEIGRQADALGVFAQQARADAVEGAGPGQGGLVCGAGGRPRAGGIALHGTRQQVAGAAGQLARRPARERQQQDALRIGAMGHQVRHAPAQRLRLAGARARQHQQRAGFRRVRPGNAEFDGLALLVVQLRQVVGRERGLRSGGGGGHGGRYVS